MIRTSKTRSRLSRRAFLKSVGASAALLPMLEGDRAYAAGTGPKRLVTIAWANGARPQVLISHTYFGGVRGWVLRRTGGIPLDRGNPGATIRALLAEAATDKPFLLVIAPEGTRGKEDYWKPGFYRISGQTGLPIGLGFVDGPTKTLGIGPTLVPSGDVRKDMDLVRAFYSDKRGVRPENRTEPRLALEEE